MKTTRVLVVLHNPMLVQSMEDLLGMDGRLRVVRSQADTPASLLHAVAEHQPNVVVTSIRLADSDAVIELLNKRPALRLIVISEENNWMSVIEKKDVLLTRAPDLLQFIHAPQTHEEIQNACD